MGTTERIAYVGRGRTLCRACALAKYERAGGDVEALEGLTWSEDDDAMYRVLGMEAVSRRRAEEEFEGEGLVCDSCWQLIL